MSFNVSSVIAKIKSSLSSLLFDVFAVYHALSIEDINSLSFSLTCPVVKHFQLGTMSDLMFKRVFKTFTLDVAKIHKIMQCLLYQISMKLNKHRSKYE